MIDEDYITSLLGKHSFLSHRESIDCFTIDCPADDLVSFLKALRDHEGFELLVDLTAIDHGEGADIRFSTVIHLYSLVHRGYVRVHSACLNNDEPTIPSVSSIYPAANWHERETFDMFGIHFNEHPNLKRILMWDEYPYFPLRKEFPLAGIDTPLPADDVVEVTQASVEPAPMMGGPFVSSGSGVISDSEPRAKDESWTEEKEKKIMSITTKEISVGDIGARGAEASSKLDGDKMALNVGPSHPTTHGVLRLIMELNGDLIDKCEPVLGYLHRGDEKIAENMTYNQFVPYTDRLDYLAPLANNVAYALAVEKLTNIEIPPRCQAIRVLVCEMARISSHLLGMGVFGMDAGAWTPFMYTFTEREKLYTLFEELTGARFTTSYTRIGGVSRDIPEGWLDRVQKFVDELPKAIAEVEKLLTRNRIFLDRTEGIGEISKEDALAYGLTGPNLRAAGVDLDLRKDKPYSGYEQYDFDVPIGTKGDCYDRYLVRIEEVLQSIRIIKQVIKGFPKGAWYAEDAKKIFAPPKEKILSSMEELIQNFMIVTEGPQIPAGEVYFEAENPKGALGFYIVSKGGGVPYRMKIRAPSFCNLSILEKLAPGHMLSDITVILGSLDFVMGECDR